VRAVDVNASPLLAGFEQAAPSGPASDALQCVNPAALPDWDEALALDPNGSFFQSAAWAKVLNDTYGYAPQYFAIREGGKICSLLPLMEVDSWLTGRRAISLPFTDDCEPVCADAAAFRLLFDKAKELGQARRWKYIELRGGREWLGDAPASLSFHGHELDLTGNESELFSRVDSSVRRAIRKAEKAGVTLEIEHTLEAVRIFYRLLCLTRKKHGLPPQPFAFFRNIHQHVISRGLGRVILARFEGRPIAAGIYFGMGQRAIYKFGASDETAQQHRGNNLVMWMAIQWHARNGFKTLHLGRTSIGNEGLRRFKLGWGAVEKPIEYVKYDLSKGQFVTDADQSSGWHTRFFNQAPIGLSRLIGRVIYRHWA
jgi:CelD/BcsL family acetyltransferase involved in cellulose biosynthesis